MQVGEYETARQTGEAMLRRYREEKSPYYEYVTNIFMPDIDLATERPPRPRSRPRRNCSMRWSRGNAAEMEYGTAARTKLALGQAAEALALTEKPIEKPDPSDAINTYLADLRLTRGRALLALGRAADARKPLLEAYEFWRAFAPDDHSFKVATYWFAQSLLVNGETEAAQRLHASPTPPRDYLPRIGRATGRAIALAAAAHRRGAGQISIAPGSGGGDFPERVAVTLR